jgi:hypothetical protein
MCSIQFHVVHIFFVLPHDVFQSEVEHCTLGSLITNEKLSSAKLLRPVLGPHLVDSERCRGKDARLCLGLSVVVTCSSEVLGKGGNEYVS